MSDGLKKESRLTYFTKRTLADAAQEHKVEKVDLSVKVDRLRMGLSILN